RKPTAATFRHNGLTNKSMIANPTDSTPATSLFVLPNGASNHTAPNAQVIAIMAVRRMNSTPSQRPTRARPLIMGMTIHAGGSEARQARQTGTDQKSRVSLNTLHFGK